MNKSENALSFALKRLSSGLRLNSARENAASMALSKRFIAQIRDANQTTRNASDPISLNQTSETNLTKTHIKQRDLQNQFFSVLTSLQTTSENLSALRNRIQDTDFAAETASLTRAQILQQAGTAMLAQANTLPNGILDLLSGE